MTSKKRSGSTSKASGRSWERRLLADQEKQRASWRRLVIYHLEDALRLCRQLGLDRNSPSPTSASAATAQASCEKRFAKAVKEGGFSDGTICEIDRLYGVAAAPPAAPAPAAGGRRRRRIKSKRPAWLANLDGKIATIVERTKGCSDLGDTSQPMNTTEIAFIDSKKVVVPKGRFAKWRPPSPRPRS